MPPPVWPPPRFTCFSPTPPFMWARYIMFGPALYWCGRSHATGGRSLPGVCWAWLPEAFSFQPCFFRFGSVFIGGEALGASRPLLPCLLSLVWRSPTFSFLSNLLNGKYGRRRRPKVSGKGFTGLIEFPCLSLSWPSSSPRCSGRRQKTSLICWLSPP